MNTLIVLFLILSSNIFALEVCIEKLAAPLSGLSTITAKAFINKYNIEAYNKNRYPVLDQMNRLFQNYNPMDLATFNNLESLYKENNYKLVNENNELNSQIERSGFYPNIEIAKQCINEYPSIKSKCADQMNNYFNSFNKIKEFDKELEEYISIYLKIDQEFFSFAKSSLDNQSNEELYNAIKYSNLFDSSLERFNIIISKQSNVQNSTQNNVIELVRCIYTIK